MTKQDLRDAAADATARAAGTALPATIAAAAAADVSPEPAPTGKPIERFYVEDVPPLIRTSFTLYPHWDVNFGRPDPVTVQCIILTEGAAEDEETCEASNLPELKEAGWSRCSLGILDVYLRVVGG